MAEHVIEVKVSELPEVVQHIKRLEGEHDAARASLLAYGTHKPGCGGLTSTTGRACECGWIQVRDLAKEAQDG